MNKYLKSSPYALHGCTLRLAQISPRVPVKSFTRGVPTVTAQALDRMLSAAVFIATVAGGALLWLHVDDLPPWARRGLARLPGAAPLFAAQGVGERPAALSKQIAYNVDTWFSTNPSSQVAAPWRPAVRSWQA